MKTTTLPWLGIGLGAITFSILAFSISMTAYYYHPAWEQTTLVAQNGALTDQLQVGQFAPLRRRFVQRHALASSSGLRATSDGVLNLANAVALVVTCTGDAKTQCLGGPDGPAGPDGYIGVDGPAGERGSNGTAGAVGEIGESGDTGENGAAGEPGLAGDAGVQGDIGYNGTNGLVGDEGDQGLAGEPGIDGQNGTQGIQGPPGDAGVNGTQGPPGVNFVVPFTSETPLASAVSPSVTASLLTNYNTKYTIANGTAAAMKVVVGTTPAMNITTTTSTLGVIQGTQNSVWHGGYRSVITDQAKAMPGLQQFLIFNNPLDNSRFGFVTTMSGDGSVIVYGTQVLGLIYVYTTQNVLRQIISTPGFTAAAREGLSVSYDGTWIAASTHNGAALLYQWDSTTYVQMPKVTFPGAGASDTVIPTISPDNSTLVLFDSMINPITGYVFTYPFTGSGKLLTSPPSFVGDSTCITTDNRRIVTSGTDPFGVGTAYFFENNSTDWNLIGTYQGPPGGDQFAYRVACGTDFVFFSEASNGAATSLFYVMSWEKAAQVGIANAFSAFPSGFAGIVPDPILAASRNDHVVALADTSSSLQGIKIFTFNGNEFVFQKQLDPDDSGGGDTFGRLGAAMAFSANGTNLAVGVPNFGQPTGDKGCVLFY